jgi:DNA polymerase III epsilon subunit-like protein
MEICIFDTETTGLLKPSPAKIESQPYITEFYGCIVDQDFNMIREYETFFDVGFPLDPIITKITGIKDSDLVGQPKFSDKVDELAKFFTGVDMMVAHNLPFDRSMLANELIRADSLIKFPWPRHHVCTVEKSIKIKGHRLKLSQLHKIITGKDFVDAHRAKNDVFALVRSFHGLVESGLIVLEDYA